jgi:4-amino-4-deoxy-L-arabinose transferase-like glycosyltransferase
LPVFLAAALTAANTLKPPLIDDTAYLSLARQIAHKPLDPYGFELFWYSEPEPANHVLAPPVLPYWLALGIRILGEEPVLLKLWLFPIALLLVISMYALLRRFARSTAEPMLALTVFSPAVLPAFNFMIDLPSLALSLAALAIFFRGLDRRSWRVAILSGLLAGLAIQAKYIGFLTPPLLVVAALLHRRLAPALLAGLTAAIVFVGWEAFVYWKYGESHFLYHLNDNPFKWEEKLELSPWLVTLVGGLAPGIAIAALARWRIAVIASALGLAVVHFNLARLSHALDHRLARLIPAQDLPGLTAIYFAFGVLAAIAMIAGGVDRLIIRWRGVRLSRRTAFLIIWLAAEIAGYFAFTPFPASRRVLGLTLVLTVVAARIVAGTCHGRRSRVWLATIPGMALGVYFTTVDAVAARLEPMVAWRAAQIIRERDPSPTIWYVGHWGFQFEAERQGMKALAPGRSVLRRGDWLVLPDSSQNQQEFQADARMGPPVQMISAKFNWKRSTRPDYYGGPLPLVYTPEMRLSATIYQIQDTWAPRP